MPKIHNPMQGVKIWENDKNGFTVFELHYSADENKRKDDWKKEASRDLPTRNWLQEYEIQWLSYTGIPVYGDWNRRVHCSDFELTPHIGLPMLIGFDFGLNAAAIVGQLQEDTLCIFREFTSINMGAERFSDYVIKQLRLYYPKWASLKRDWLCFIDPSGQFRKDTDEGTCAKVLDSKGFSCRPGPVSFEARRQSVEHFLVRMANKKPCLQINAVTCPLLVAGFDGGYRYPDKALEVEQTVLSPVKDQHSHIHDALQYLCSGVININKQMQKHRVPRPEYNMKRR